MINVIGLFTLPSTWLSLRNEIKMCVEWDFPGKSCKNHDGNKEWLILPKSIKHRKIHCSSAAEQIRCGLDNCGYIKRQIKVFFLYYSDYYSACSCCEGLTALVSAENKPLDTEMIVNLQRQAHDWRWLLSKLRLFETFQQNVKETSAGVRKLVLLFTSVHSDVQRFDLWTYETHSEVHLVNVKISSCW